MAALFRHAPTDAAFERLYKRHVEDVYRYTFAVLGERADAEDVTQTTFLNAYRAFQRGERPEKAQNWLITIAHNVCRQRFRQEQRRPQEVEFDDAIGGAVEERDGPTVDDFRRAFSQLPPNQRAALVMRELEGRSYAEVAAVLEISVSALETLLFRARRALREQLEGQLRCSEAGFAISKQLDGRLSSEEQRGLRAHLRACPECRSAASRQRAQRRVLKTMLAVPLPQSLTSFFGGAGAGVASTAAAVGGTGVVLKAAAILTAGVAVGGGAYVGVAKPPLVHRHHSPPATDANRAPANPARVRLPQVVTGGSQRAAVAHGAATKPKRGHGKAREERPVPVPVPAVKENVLPATPQRERSAHPTPPATAHTPNRAARSAQPAPQKAAPKEKRQHPSLPQQARTATQKQGAKPEPAQGAGQGQGIAGKKESFVLRVDVASG